MIPVRPIKLTEADKIRFLEKVDRRDPDGCWEWQARRDKDGYGHFGLNGSSYQTHRVAFAVTNGDTDLLVLHTCDNPPCCNPNHLFAGTIKINSQQRDDRGRAANTRGEGNGHTKLTEDDVHEIRRLYAGGWLQHEIAEDYGISQSTVSKICTYKNWKHI